MSPLQVAFKTWDGVLRSWKIPRTVYPPREDTQFLSDVLKEELRNRNSCRILEIGPGSGAVTMALALEGHRVTAIDIHPEAVAVTRGVAESHGLSEQIIVHEQDVRTLNFDSSYDLIVWNAPYLDPISPGAQTFQWRDEVSLTASVADHQYLSSNIQRGQGLGENGFLLLILSDGDTCKQISRVYADDGWAMRPLARTRHGGEHLVALCLWRPWPESRIFTLEEAESTNQVALETIGLEPGDRVVAKNQTSGKGRKGRTWDSRTGDLTSSWVLPTIGQVIEKPHIIQLRSALAATDAVQRWTGSTSIAFDSANAWHNSLGLKWPNDLMIFDKKYGGILLEARQQGLESRIVLGIGINISQAPQPWGSLSELNPSGDVEQLTHHMTAAIAHWFDRGPAGAPPSDAETLGIAHRAMSRWGAERQQPLSLNQDGLLLVQEP